MAATRHPASRAHSTDRSPLDHLVAHLVTLAGPRPRVLVAFSGGVDSTVLAHALVRARRHLGALRLAYVDHGLHSASAAWSRHCAHQARAWRVPFVSLRARVDLRNGDSPEAAARDARYRALAGVLSPGEVLVTAQHRDDQVETLLLQLFRGAGVAGLAAMPGIAHFAAGRIARPLLGVSRAELVEHARAHGLRWIDDPSNADHRFARNYLRHEILPALRQRWPGLDAALARSARHMAEAQSLLSSVVSQDLARLADGAGLRVTGLKALPRARRMNALREFLRAAGATMPPATLLAEIAGPLLAVRGDARPEVTWSDWVVTRHAGRLELKEKARGPGVENASKSWRWRKERECVINSAGDRLRLVADARGPLDLDLLPPVLELRARQGGEALRPGPRARTRTLKKLLQAARLPPEERARLPLLFGEGPKGRLLAVGDRWLDASVMANVKSRRRARLVWKRND